MRNNPPYFEIGTTRIIFWDIRAKIDSWKRCWSYFGVTWKYRPKEYVYVHIMYLHCLINE